MPSSRYDIIPFVLDRVVEMKPKSILDIGIGYGKWGVLFREYLDIWDVNEPFDKRGVNIIGVEAFEDYKNSIWDVYDEVLIGDIKEHLSLLRSKPMFDLLFMGDIIEHFNKETGKRLLKELVYDKAIIVTPKLVSPQKVVYNNEYETHYSSWELKDFDYPDVKQYTLNNIQVFTYDNCLVNDTA